MFPTSSEKTIKKKSLIWENKITLVFLITNHVKTNNTPPGTFLTTRLNKQFKMQNVTQFHLNVT